MKIYNALKCTSWNPL